MRVTIHNFFKQNRPYLRTNNLIPTHGSKNHMLSLPEEFAVILRLRNIVVPTDFDLTISYFLSKCYSNKLIFDGFRMPIGCSKISRMFNVMTLSQHLHPTWATKISRFSNCTESYDCVLSFHMIQLLIALYMYRKLTALNICYSCDNDEF